MILQMSARRRRALVYFAGFLLVFYIIYSYYREKPIQTGPKVFPKVRFLGKSPQLNEGNVELRSSKTGVPHIIHQTWKTTAIPESVVRWVRSWLKYHPEYQYWFWTDKDIERLVTTSFPELKPLFDSYPESGYKADAFRYLILFSHGGVYADLDMENLNPLDDIINKHGCFLSQEPIEHAHFLAPVGIPLVSNALMACRPKHSFFKRVVQRLSINAGWLQWNDILHATGPYMLTKEYHIFNKDKNGWFFSEPQTLFLAPAEVFQPLVDRSMLDIMRRNCLPGQTQRGWSFFISESYIELQGRMCGKIQGRSLLDKPLPNSLTVHHFTHLWAGKMYDPWGVFNSQDTIEIQDILTT